MLIGTSKSVLFMLPIVVGVRGVTIIVILFVILRYNIRVKSVKAGVLVGE